MHRTNKNELIDKLSIVGIRVLVTASLLLGLSLMLFSGYAIYEQLYTQNRAFSSGIINTAEVYTVEAQENLVQTYKDYRAWLKIDKTSINYPVMQSDDDLYYANHKDDGTISPSGAIYMAAGNTADLSDDYILIYGHHITNGAMFGDLDLFLDKDFFDSNSGGTFVFPDGSVYDLQLWAVVNTDAYEDEVYSVETQEFDDVVEYVNAYSKYIKPSAIDNAKKIIALSTCQDAITNGRLVVFYTLKETPKQQTATTTTPATEDTTEIDTTPIAGKPNTGDGTTTIEDKPITPDKPETNDKPDKPVEPDDNQTTTPEEIDTTPTSWWVPSGSSYGQKAWAIINLLCLIVTVYILIPIFFLRKKYGRVHKMRKVNKTKESLFDAQDMSPEDWKERERIMKVATQKSDNGYVSKDLFSKAVEELFFRVKVFTGKFITGIILEVIFTVAGVIIYILTEDMTLPMVLIDKWTPVMLLLMIGSMLADFILTRYKRPKKDRNKENEENEIRLND
ncbi:MAG: class B sortase [Lachnospiraceae bacterium]|nr:class B sortase [Lachnospiraceae bacterium]